MKPVVVFYSHTGKTKSVAGQIASLLGAELQEIREMRKRGILGILGGGMQAARKKKSEIAPIERSLQAYDTLIVGTPVWAGNMTPAVRAFLEAADLSGKTVACFCTTGGTGARTTLEGMARLAKGASVLVPLSLTAKELAEEQKAKEKVQKWVEDVILARQARA